MRDAFGGAGLIRWFLIFLGIYIIFIGIAINYAKAFRVKNKVISIIDTYGYINENCAVKTDTDAIIKEYLSSVHYNPNVSQHTITNSDCMEGSTLGNNGVCIKKISTDPNTYYYSVSTYLVFNFPIFGIEFPISINGETRQYYNSNC
ncbi:MAG: hypothetical protein Q4G04_00320 [bacterium]|nr:hypothetical protein [bacterium]